MRMNDKGAIAAIALAMTLVGGLRAHAEPKSDAPDKCKSAALAEVSNVVTWTVQGHIGKLGKTGGQKITVRIEIQVNEKGKVGVKSAIAINEDLDKRDVLPALGEDLEKDLKNVKVKAGGKSCEATIEVVISRDN
jgi:hypothetical protein